MAAWVIVPRPSPRSSTPRHLQRSRCGGVNTIDINASLSSTSITAAATAADSANGTSTSTNTAYAAADATTNAATTTTNTNANANANANAANATTNAADAAAATTTRMSCVQPDGDGAGQFECTVVDFGAGSGNSALCFAAVLPRCMFVLVDRNPINVQLGRRRVAAAALPNVKWWCGDVADYDAPFDVALATHLCGDATDIAIEKSVGIGATFVATPCCLGKVARTAEVADRDGTAMSIEYPHSDWLRGALQRKTYLELIRLSDYNNHTAVGKCRATCDAAQRNAHGLCDGKQVSL
jgi:hypothetical protein